MQKENTIIRLRMLMLHNNKDYYQLTFISMNIIGHNGCSGIIWDMCVLKTYSTFVYCEVWGETGRGPTFEVPKT